MRVPLFIEFRERNVLVIGGGDVGTKRAKKFLEAGANVVVLSREFSPELQELAREGRVILQTVDLEKPESVAVLDTWISWADLVVYTIPNKDLANIVRELCRKHRKLLNDATDAERTDVVVPFEARLLEGIRIVVTTEGRSSVLSRLVLQKIISYLEQDQEIKNLASAWFTVKKYLKETVPNYKTRMRLYTELAQDKTFLELATRGELERVMEYVRRKVEELSSSQRTS